MVAGTSGQDGTRGAGQAEFRDRIVRHCLLAAVFWGLIGTAVGVYLSFELLIPALNTELPWLNYGRLRPVHTTLLIFGFGGNALIGASLYIVQRTCGRGLAAPRALHDLVFWAYQAFPAMAALGYLAGVTQGKEYAEAEWYADLWLLAVWIGYGAIYLASLSGRRTRELYVSNWFFLAVIIGFAVLHVGNNLAAPMALVAAGSVPWVGGVSGALVQWWYGHNLFGFFFILGFLGILYYVLPNRVGQPVYSYRLAVLHFWSCVFVLLLTGPQHLQHTSVPGWLQTMGMTMAVILWMPTWGGVVNGFMTLNGVWDRLRTDMVLRFLMLALAFFAWSALEGVLLAIPPVNDLSHYTDWTGAHVHAAAMGWMAMLIFGTVYHLVPRLWPRARPLSLTLMIMHFWLCVVGIVLYISALWASGLVQGLLWRAMDEAGQPVVSFVDGLAAIEPYWIARALGGVLFFAGMIVMTVNIRRALSAPGVQSVPAPGGVPTASR